MKQPDEMRRYDGHEHDFQEDWWLDENDQEHIEHGPCYICGVTVGDSLVDLLNEIRVEADVRGIDLEETQ